MKAPTDKIVFSTVYQQGGLAYYFYGDVHGQDSFFRVAGGGVLFFCSARLQKAYGDDSVQLLS